MAQTKNSVSKIKPVVYSVDVPVDLKKLPRKALQQIATQVNLELERRGYLVVGYWSPEEVKTIKGQLRHATDRICELGNEVINDLS